MKHHVPYSMFLTLSWVLLHIMHKLFHFVQMFAWKLRKPKTALPPRHLHLEATVTKTSCLGACRALMFIFNYLPRVGWSWASSLFLDSVVFGYQALLFHPKLLCSLLQKSFIQIVLLELFLTRYKCIPTYKIRK